MRRQPQEASRQPLRVSLDEASEDKKGSPGTRAASSVRSAYGHVIASGTWIVALRKPMPPGIVGSRRVAGMLTG